MRETDSSFAAVLEGATPRYDAEHGDWDAVLRDARRPSKRRWALRLVPALAAAAAAGLVALGWPFSSEPGGVLERALAAIGNGPVVHVVMREDSGGTLIDLRSGERRDLRGGKEIWYDPERGMHVISRFGGIVQEEFLWGPERVPSYERKTYAGFADGYRAALAGGTAKVAGPGVVEGIPVIWIKVESKWLPDVADGKLHEWAQEVAVSRETYEPVAKRESRDGNPAEQTGGRILEFELLPKGSGDFDAERANEQPLSGGAIMCCGPGEDIDAGQASGVLARPALWLGREFEGLRLTRVARTQYGLRPKGAEEWQLTYGVRFEYGGREVVLEEITRLHPAFGATFVPPEGNVYVSYGRASLRVGDVYVSIRAPSDAVAVDAARALRPVSVESGGGG